ncbi:unnamed protein product [Ectocarpus sp. 6 AP-2014]
MHWKAWCYHNQPLPVSLPSPLLPQKLAVYKRRRSNETQKSSCPRPIHRRIRQQNQEQRPIRQARLLSNHSSDTRPKCPTRILPSLAFRANQWLERAVPMQPKSGGTAATTHSNRYLIIADCATTPPLVLVLEPWFYTVSRGPRRG